MKKKLSMKTVSIIDNVDSIFSMLFLVGQFYLLVLLVVHLLATYGLMGATLSAVVIIGYKFQSYPCKLIDYDTYD